jgi:hypothetical protein
VPDTTRHVSISLDSFVAGPDQSRENPLGRRGQELHAEVLHSPLTTHIRYRRVS